MNIHHNTAKRAKAHGVQLDFDADGETVVAVANGRVLARSHDPKDALNVAIRELLGEVDKVKAQSTPKSPKSKGKKPAKAKKARRAADDEDFEDESDEDEGEDKPTKSVIKPKYRRIYKSRPLRYTCSDEWAYQLNEYLVFTDEDGVKRIDLDKLQKFAEANEVWVGSYASLNPGMQRLNVGNRLRAKVKKGWTVVWP